MNSALLADVLVNSIIVASLYALAGLGWVLVYRASSAFNFATGQYIVLSGYVFFTLNASVEAPFVVSIIGTLLIMAVVGATTYFGLFAPLVGRPLFTTVIMSLGLSFVLARLMNVVWGSQTRILDRPFEQRPIQLGEATVNTYGVASVVAAVVFIAFVMTFFKYSRTGVTMRAAAEEPLLANLRGISVQRMNAIGWSLAMAGLALASLFQSYSVGLSPAVEQVGLRGLIPALVGGLDSVGGTALAALAIAAIENLLVAYAGPEVRDAGSFAVLFVVLLVRPYGLFGTPLVRRV